MTSVKYPKRTSKVENVTHERVLELFDYNPETGEITNKAPRKKVRVGESAGYLRPDGYFEVSFDYTRVLAHRLAWFYMYRDWPEVQIDHIDRDRGNNRISNLRPATNKQNMENANLQRNNTSGVRGVVKAETHGKWFAYIKHNGVKFHLGTFAEKEHAIAARQEAEAKYFTRMAEYA